jgi:hypothetical protein
MFSLQKNSENKRAEQVLSGSGEEVAQTMYTHVNNCKNDKIRKRKHGLENLNTCFNMKKIK